MALPLLAAAAKSYALGKAKNFVTGQAEQALGLPRDSIAVATNPVGFAKNLVKDTAKDYIKNSFSEKQQVPVEDLSPSSGSAGTSVGKNGKPEAIEHMEWEGSYKRGGKVKASSASRRADGIAQRGKTKGRYL